ncbi:YlmC/YmxH family sporulation protein [Tissierella creatinini]|nr:YlmC/YmxH family sporulation protein [Tissierella creatinini]TJX64419.1 YlmC/YmxH family sporulation protein [Soehngenia saccharolytica]
MLKVSELRDKEVINLYNGQRMGYISDFEVDLEKGSLVGIIMPGENKVMSFFSKNSDIIIQWNKIVKIGNDTILVNLKDE